MFFYKNKKKANVEHNIINMLDYHYRIDGIYNDLLIVDLDVETCEINKGQIVKILNKLYEVHNVEFIPSNNLFKYRLMVTEI
jgi:hypothetical protein